jgi:hypothetical protein
VIRRPVAGEDIGQAGQHIIVPQPAGDLDRKTLPSGLSLVQRWLNDRFSF